MKKIFFAFFITLIYCTITASAAEYVVSNNLLYNTPPEQLKISSGTIITKGAKSPNDIKVLYDGLYDTVSALSGTRWAVESKPLGATLDIELNNVSTIGKIIISSGYADISNPKPEILSSFDIEYFDGVKYTTAYSIKDNSDKFIELDYNPFCAKKLRLVSTQDSNFRIREIVLLKPGVDMFKTDLSNDNIFLNLNGTDVELNMDSAKLLNNTVLVSTKFAKEQLGCNVKWVDDKNQVIIERDGVNIIYTVESDKVVVNGEEMTITCPVQKEESRVYVPIRNLCEALKYKVDYISRSNTINIVDYNHYHDLSFAKRGVSPYKVYVDDTEKEVFTTSNSDFINLSANNEKTINVLYNEEINSVDIRPLSKNIKYNISKDKKSVSFSALPNQFLSVEINKNLDRPLFVFFSDVKEMPKNSDMNIICFDANKQYDIGINKLESNTIVYLGENCIVNGTFSAMNAENIKIIGNGIIRSKNSCTKFVNCSNVEVDGPIAVYTTVWGNKWFGVNHGKILNYKILGSLVYSDGIDLLACKNVDVDNVFIRNEDDGVCIKTKRLSHSPVYGDTTNINVTNSTVWSGESGNSLEIGYELDDAIVSNIRYNDIDVIHRGTKETKFNRAAISIHNAGNGTVQDVVYDNIRVESSQENLVYFDCFNIESWGSGNGNIKDITIKNLTLLDGDDVTSYIGKNATDMSEINNINFVNLMYKGKIIDSLDKALECGFIIKNGITTNFTTDESLLR